jgi:hypothetical protein
MRKKKLDPETLVVQAFETLPEPRPLKGTVHGYASGAWGAQCVSLCPNCWHTTSIDNDDPPPV